MEALMLGLAIYFASTLLRAFPWPSWLAQRRPLSCATCCAGWFAIASWCVMGGWEEHWWSITILCGAAAGVALLVEALVTLLRGNSNDSSSWPPPPSA